MFVTVIYWPVIYFALGSKFLFQGKGISYRLLELTIGSYE